MGSIDASSASEAHAVAVDGYADFDEDDADDVELDGPSTRGGGQGTFLTDLADVLRHAGLTVTEESGWETRCYPRLGGFKHGVKGIVAHHTGGKGTSAQADANRITWILSGDKLAPLANLYLDRNGGWRVLAAGCTNTNGRGGPWRDKIPARAANSRCIGIEAGISGKERWPTVMQDSYVKGVAALADHFDVDSNDVFSHEEWVRGHEKRWKWDPAGPSRFGSINGSGTWDMDKFRNEVNAARRKAGTVTTTTSSSTTDFDSGMYVIEEGDSWWSIAEKTMGDPANTWEQLAEANGGRHRVLLVGAAISIPGKAGSTGAGSTGGATTGSAAADFPGEARLGMKGPIVLAWQKALIGHGHLRDTIGNNDADFGEGLERIIRELQQSWGWSDADGVGGEHTWKKLHGGS